MSGNIASPVHLGVWSVSSRDDLHEKLKSIRSGARQLLKMGLKTDKHLSFYSTTYNVSSHEIDTLKTTTLGEMANMQDSELDRFIPSPRRMSSRA